MEGRTSRRAYVAKAEAAAAAAAKAGLRKRLWEAEGARSDLLRRKLLEAEATEAVLRRKLAEPDAVLLRRLSELERSEFGPKWMRLGGEGSPMIRNEMDAAAAWLRHHRADAIELEKPCISAALRIVAANFDSVPAEVET